jgi:hypothetical protein
MLGRLFAGTGLDVHETRFCGNGPWTMAAKTCYGTRGCRSTAPLLKVSRNANQKG